MYIDLMPLTMQKRKFCDDAMPKNSKDSRNYVRGGSNTMGCDPANLPGGAMRKIHKQAAVHLLQQFGSAMRLRDRATGAGRTVPPSSAAPTSTCCTHFEDLAALSFGIHLCNTCVTSVTSDCNAHLVRPQPHGARRQTVKLTKAAAGDQGNQGASTHTTRQRASQTKQR